MDETGETSASAPEALDARLKNGKMNRRTSKAALTRAGNALNHLIDAKRPREEVSESLLLYKQTYETLVLKHEEYICSIENDEGFTVEEHSGLKNARKHSWIWKSRRNRILKVK